MTTPSSNVGADASHKSVPENPPAFPTEWSWGLVPGEPMQTGEHTAQYPGMTLRDWFAGQALAGLLSTDTDFHDEAGDGWDWHARAAYSMADAMLKAREASK